MNNKKIMITEDDIKQVNEIKEILSAINQKIEYKFNWEIVNKIDCLDRLVKNLKIAPLSFKFCPPGGQFYTAECKKCGWWGSSELLDGGGQIADTGDYGDCYCPVCGNSNLDEKEEDSQEKQNKL